MTDTMRAMMLEAWGDSLTPRRIPVPRAGPGEVVVRVGACGVGLTVLNAMNGRMQSRPEWLPRIPGHEIAGWVHEVGPGVGSPCVGDRVVAHFYLTCGECRWCRQGRESLCANFAGYLGLAIDGGYAEYVRMPARNAVKIPGTIGMREATAIPDAIATPYHVCRARAPVRPGEQALVIGAAGGVGIHMVQMAALFGADVIAVDRDDAKLGALAEYGARHTLHFDRCQPEDVRCLAGGAVDVAVDLAGTPQTLGFALASLGRGGRLVCLTTHPGVELPVSPRRLVQEEVTVIGARYCSRFEIEEAAALVAAGKIRPVVSDACELEDVDRIHRRIRAGNLLGRGAIVF